jgi:hypothetical protein
MESLLDVAGNVFGLSSDKREELKLAIEENGDLSSLLASNCVSAGRDESKRRVSKKVSGDRCDALVWMLEKNESGEWVPKQCTRGCESGTSFCKKHGERVSKHCVECSDFQGHDVVHEFYHEHNGSVTAGPSFLIGKFWDVLLKKSNVCDKHSSSDGECGVVPEKKPKKSVVPAEKQTRSVDNPFMNYLSAHRAEIKSDLLSDGNVSGRELTTLVSKRGGEMWKALSKEEQQTWKGKKTDVSTEVNQSTKSDETQPSGDTVSSVVIDEDEADLVFNSDHSVWVDEDTNLYYGSNDVQSVPLGQLLSGKLMPFKKAATKKN